MSLLGDEQQKQSAAIEKETKAIEAELQPKIAAYLVEQTALLEIAAKNPPPPPPASDAGGKRAGVKPPPPPPAPNVGALASLCQTLLESNRFRGKAELRLHHPVPGEVALVCDKPWEGDLAIRWGASRLGRSAAM